MKTIVFCAVLTILSVVLNPLVAGTKLILYPPIVTSAESDVFTVIVNGEPVFVENYEPSEVEKHYSLELIEGDITYHYAQFAFEGTAEIEIRRAKGFNSYILSPKSFGIAPSLDGSIMEFVLDEPKKLVLKVENDWLYILADPIDSNAPKAGDDGVLNIQDYNVDPSGKELNTYEIQKAIIDVATGPYGGRTLYFPPGVYKTGTLELYSGVTLYLAPGAVLQASSNPLHFPIPFGPDWRTERDYDHGETDVVLIPPGPPDRDYGYNYALLRIHHCENVAVKGPGILDASGGSNGRLKVIHVMASKNVTVRDVTLRHGHGWMFPILNSEHVRVHNVKLLSAITSNTDGINPDSSTDVIIDGAFVVTGDDPIVVKSTNFGMQLRPEVRDVVIKNNTVMTVKSALKIGTETRSDRYNNILFKNNDIVTSDRAFVIYLRDGATMENIYFNNNRVEQAGGISDDQNRIFDIAISNRDRRVIWQIPGWDLRKENPGRIRNLIFEDISIDTEGSQFLIESRVTGYNKTNNIDGITFRNIVVDGTLISDQETEITVSGGKSIKFIDIDRRTVRNIWFQGNKLD